jgi:hypothetical protein
MLLGLDFLTTFSIDVSDWWNTVCGIGLMCVPAGESTIWQGTDLKLEFVGPTHKLHLLTELLSQWKC